MTNTPDPRHAGHGSPCETDPDGSCAGLAPELTADEARAEVERLGTELYHAQDGVAFVREMCDLADRRGTTVTTAMVRQWLEGPKCGRQLIDAPAPSGHVYLSTGCLHGDQVLPDGRTGHAYCQGDTGHGGSKVPARCKFCAAPCVCPCHREAL